MSPEPQPRLCRQPLGQRGGRRAPRRAARPTAATGAWCARSSSPRRTRKPGACPSTRMMGRMMGEYFLPLLSNFGFLEYLKHSPEVPDSDVTAEYCARHNWLVGSPATVAEKLEKVYEDVGGFGQILVFGFDYAENPEAWRTSLGLLQTEVLPRVKHLVPKPAAGGGGVAPERRRRGGRGSGAPVARLRPWPAKAPRRRRPRPRPGHGGMVAPIADSGSSLSDRNWKRVPTGMRDGRAGPDLDGLLAIAEPPPHPPAARDEEPDLFHSPVRHGPGYGLRRQGELRHAAPPRLAQDRAPRTRPAPRRRARRSSAWCRSASAPRVRAPRRSSRWRCRRPRTWSAARSACPAPAARGPGSPAAWSRSPRADGRARSPRR